MKILYLSDSYAQTVQGTKISIFNEMRKRGFNITFQNVHTAGQNRIHGKNLLKTLQEGKYTDLWISHTWCTYAACTLQDINNLGVKVLGFGFSDPYDWDSEKLKMYNVYSTNHLDTYNDLSTKFPTIYMPTACDTRFHRSLELEKTTDILIYGIGTHPRFKPNTYRITMAEKLLQQFKNIKVFGTEWEHIPCQPPITGNTFLTEINRAKLSVDLQQDWAPLAHRMFECMACGTPVITRDRKEVRTMLPTDNEILTYTDYDSLATQISKLLNNATLHAELKNTMYKNTRENHNIDKRIDHLLHVLATHSENA